MAQSKSKSKNTMGIDRAVDRLLSGDRVIRSHEHDQIEQQKGDKSNELMSLNLLVPTPAESEEINKFSSHSYIRVPCKARGVRGTHIARNAYIDVPINAAHGDILLCSNKACRSSGRIFRYCKVCDMPTAKRNFIKRHGHGLDVSGLLLEDGAEGDHVSSDQDDEDHSIKQFFQRKTGSLEVDCEEILNSPDQDQMSLLGSYAALNNEESSMSFNDNNGKNALAVSADQEQTQVAKLEPDQYKINKIRQEKKEDQDKNEARRNEKEVKEERNHLVLVSHIEAEWLALLRSKPDDKKDNKASRLAWLLKILAFADTECLGLISGIKNRFESPNLDSPASLEGDESLSEVIGGSSVIDFCESTSNFDNVELEDIFDSESD